MKFDSNYKSDCYHGGKTSLSKTRQLEERHSLHHRREPKNGRGAGQKRRRNPRTNQRTGREE